MPGRPQEASQRFSLARIAGVASRLPSRRRNALSRESWPAGSSAASWRYSRETRLSLKIVATAPSSAAESRRGARDLLAGDGDAQLGRVARVGGGCRAAPSASPTASASFARASPGRARSPWPGPRPPWSRPGGRCRARPRRARRAASGRRTRRGSGFPRRPGPGRRPGSRSATRRRARPPFPR